MTYGVKKATGKRVSHMAGLALIAGLVAVVPSARSADVEERANIQVVASLASAVSLELGRLPCSASTEDMEAAIMFRISQSGAANAAAIAALQQVRVTPNLCANARSAIDMVIRNLRKPGGGATVAALGGGQDAFFSLPSTGAGGGSNYSSSPQ